MLSLRQETAEKQYENSRAGLLAKDLKEGQNCPVCGSVHHPKLAVITDVNISEDALNGLKTKEAEKLDKKTDAFSQAESAKTALEQFEEILRVDLMDCLENPVFGERNLTGESLDSLAALLSKADKDIKERDSANVRMIHALERDCRELKASSENLSKAQGEETERLEEEKEALRLRKQENENKKTQIATTLETLKILGFSDWNTAKKEMDQASKEAKAIMDALDNASKKKQEAEHLLVQCHRRVVHLRGEGVVVELDK